MARTRCNHRAHPPIDPGKLHFLRHHWAPYLAAHDQTRLQPFFAELMGKYMNLFGLTPLSAPWSGVPDQLSPEEFQERQDTALRLAKQIRF
ncbi:hypothetical protein K438DRAFT_1967637 [Mycena galopus ATCC 62051]|nr:hypothetical protein K438DRAFT_1967637 [Mycena galopus ATCC 62051]